MSLRPAHTFLALAAVVALPAATHAQTKLRWKFTEGAKRHYTMSQNMQTSAKVMDQNIESTMTQTLEMTWDVKKVESDGSARMAQTIDRMRMSVKGPMGEMKFDSKEPDAASPQLEPLKNLTGALIGQPIELTMTAAGEVKDVKLPEKLRDAVKSAGPLGGMFSEEGLKNMTSQGSLSFPEKALSDGDTWKKAVTLDMPAVGKMVIDTTYTFRGPADDAQKIDAALDMRIENSTLGLSIKSQKNSATFLFDNDKGLLRKSEVSQDMTFGGNIMGQDFSQHVKTKVVMKLGEPSASPEKSEK